MAFDENLAARIRTAQRQKFPVESSSWQYSICEKKQAGTGLGKTDLAPASKSGPRKGVWVQVPPSVL